jgi:hypothetical protein
VDFKHSSPLVKAEKSFLSEQNSRQMLLKCLTLLRDHCLVNFISHGHSSSLKASFESE